MLTPSAIAAAGAGRLGETLTVVPRTESTNADLLAAARRGAPHGAVLVAETQTAGRGRLGRRWHASPAENLTLSVLLRPSGSLASFPPLALVAGVAVAEAVEEACGVEALLKWPNDLLVGPRKLAGILAEVVDGAPPALVVGIGVNVNQQEFPEELRRDATSLRLETGRDHAVASVAAPVLRHLASRLEQVEGGGLGAVLAAWTARSWCVGRRLRVGDVKGTARGVDRDGALLLEDQGGEIRRVIGGTPVDL